MNIFWIFIILMHFNMTDQEIGDASTRISIDDFEEGLGDSWKGRAKKYQEIYKIDSTIENKYISASSLNSDNFIIKKINVDIVQYPYLNWKWRAVTLPKNGDESVKKNCDVAASVNVVLRASKWRPQTIKYSWSTDLPKGTQSQSPFARWPSRADIVVVESGDEFLNHWKTEKVHVLSDYLRLYDKDTVESFCVEALVIMTDSDNTGTMSEADYDDIYFSKN